MGEQKAVQIGQSDLKTFDLNTPQQICFFKFSDIVKALRRLQKASIRTPEQFFFVLSSTNMFRLLHKWVLNVFCDLILLQYFMA